eukprot:TRINITY_DN8424_c0_g1_i1.p1 TRINITY_DN8424_c0_g1~~TRINITY_DN8424_c0_g1_i1.p1  ORF type:complete len:698 (+),score=183.89 TRINITY_DN8424_c0_g1_i1:187-2094(+)
MVHGTSTTPYVGNVPANYRLHIPSLSLEDGPQGVGDGTKLVTAWPSALTVVATWDRDLMYQYGTAMGKEQRDKGTNIMLGPMVNILRVPVEGRSFESFGEDTHLASQMAIQSVQGIQSNGIMACVKHLVDNNQEYNRTTTSANIDERTQYEVYMPPFKAAIDAGVASIMCSYNRINNVYACENNDTLNTAAKDRFGFQGFVMSDWGATHSTVESANNGLDMQMPDDSFFGPALEAAIHSGKVPQSRLDDMVVRILTSMFSVGIFDNPVTGNLSVNVQSKAHTKLARDLGTAANILLKNDNNVLPLNVETIKNIAVIGDDAFKHPTAVGFGSGHVIAPYIVSPLEGIQYRLGSRVTVNYADTANVTWAKQYAQEADVAIVFVAVDSSEGRDRPDLSLGAAQDSLVSAVAAVQKNIIVVVHAPGPVFMPWSSEVAGIFHALLPGQEDGHCISDVLFGDVNPSGRLPFTNPSSTNPSPLGTTIQYPGINNEATYSEKLLVGYKWYDANNVVPLFHFGHGLSYSTFHYSDITIGTDNTEHTVIVQFNLANTGKVEGHETPQLYIGFPSSAGEPVKQLRGFEKVHLWIQQTKTIDFTLTAADLSIWDVNTHDWALVKGTFNVFIGSSAGKTHLQGTFQIN